MRGGCRLRSTLVLLCLAGATAWLLRSCRAVFRVVAARPAAGRMPPATMHPAPASSQRSGDSMEGAAGPRRPDTTVWSLTGALLHQEVLDIQPAQPVLVPPVLAQGTPTHRADLPPSAPSSLDARSADPPPSAPLRRRPAGAGARGTDQRLPRNPPEECLAGEEPVAAFGAVGQQRGAAEQGVARQEAPGEGEASGGGGGGDTGGEEGGDVGGEGSIAAAAAGRHTTGGGLGNTAGGGLGNTAGVGLGSASRLPSYDLLVLILSSRQAGLFPEQRRAAVRRAWLRGASDLGAPYTERAGGVNGDPAGSVNSNSAGGVKRNTVGAVNRHLAGGVNGDSAGDGGAVNGTLWGDGAPPRCAVRHVFVVGGARRERLGGAGDLLLLPVDDGYRSISKKVSGC
jgi:hypothetical protein